MPVKKSISKLARSSSLTNPAVQAVQEIFGMINLHTASITLLLSEVFYFCIISRVLLQVLGPRDLLGQQEVCLFLVFFSRCICLYVCMYVWKTIRLLNRLLSKAAIHRRSEK